jgi:hypothetical protein
MRRVAIVCLPRGRTVSDDLHAFNGHGWKLRVTLLADETATLSVLRRLRSRARLVFMPATQSRVWRHGVGAADSKVSFGACSRANAPRWSGWPGRST